MAQKSKMQKSFLTPNEVAHLLMVSPTTIRQWASEGKIQSSVTPGGHRRFMRSEVERFSRDKGLTLLLPDDDTTRILIVDDDEDILELLTKVFEHAESPVSTATASSGFEAGRLVQSFQPHVVLLDLTMPGIDGFAVCRCIKQDAVTRAIRVVAMTGFYESEIVNRILDAGAETCLRKPLKAETLMKTIGID